LSTKNQCKLPTDVGEQAGVAERKSYQHTHAIDILMDHVLEVGLGKKQLIVHQRNLLAKRMVILLRGAIQIVK